ncbi:BamA/TamA family outer membrane protein [Mucilaginibacter koreensis]
MKYCLTLLLLLTLGLYTRLLAQETKSVPIPSIIPAGKNTTPQKDTLVIDNKGVPQKDFGDVIRQLFHRPPAAGIDSVTSKPEISIVPAIGYTLVSRFAIVLSGNVAWRRAPQSRISTIIASADYTQNKQFTIPIQTSIWSKNNEWNFLGDYRFYKYPQSTYGLGSNADIKDENPMDFSFARFYETALHHITGNLYAGLGYIVDTHWNISDQGPLNGAPNDYRNYGARSHTISSGNTLNAVYDSRDFAINPSNGWLASLTYRRADRFLGSTTPWSSLLIDVRRYYRFPASSNNIIAFWTYDWLTLNGRPSYLDLPSTSWDQNSATGRGYIQGRFRGAQMLYLESEYRFQLTHNGLLGGVVFVNAQTLSAAPGTKLQSIQPAIGPGLRIKLNKTSRTNVAIDYGFGRQGSKGLFIDVGEAF